MTYRDLKRSGNVILDHNAWLSDFLYLSSPPRGQLECCSYSVHFSIVPAASPASSMRRFISLPARQLRPAPRVPTPRLRVSYPATLRFASSAPKKAEEASAQSGGSRSKDAAESAATNSSESPAEADAVAEGSAAGATGGGEPLEASKNPPPQPKIHNASIPGHGMKLSKEQQEEVDAHNADFDKKHDRASPASDDKVNKEFWGGGGTRDK
jgi:hypothetical protein